LFFHPKTFQKIFILFNFYSLNFKLFIQFGGGPRSRSTLEAGLKNGQNHPDACKRAAAATDMPSVKQIRASGVPAFEMLLENRGKRT